MRSVATGFLIFLFWVSAAEARADGCETYTAGRPDAPAGLAELFAKGFASVTLCRAPTAGGQPDWIVYWAETRAARGPLGVCSALGRRMFRITKNGRDAWSETPDGDRRSVDSSVEVSMYLPRGACPPDMPSHSVSVRNVSEDVFVRFHLFWKELLEEATQKEFSRAGGHEDRRALLEDLRRMFGTDGEPAGLLIAEDVAAGRYLFMVDPRPHERWVLSLVLDEGRFRMEKMMLATYHRE